MCRANLKNSVVNKEKRLTANTDLDKYFNSSGGHDRLDRTKSLTSLNSLSKNKNIEKGDRITPLTLLLSAGQGVVNLITGNKGKSQLQKNIQKIYNTHKLGYIKKK